MSHKLRSKKPVTRGKQYDYVKMSKGIPPKDDDSDVSQKVLDKEDTLIGAEGVAPHPYEVARPQALWMRKSSIMKKLKPVNRK